VRILLYTGKGGVGKTSVAAATALRCASLGYRTIVLSTDSAHSLGDSFDLELGPEPTPIVDNLWGQECDISYNLDRHWGTVQKWVQSLLQWQGVDSMVAEEIAVLPGMEELANLLWINQHHAEGKFDVIIVDCAPSAETFRLLSFPDVARWWIDKLLPIERTLTRVARPIMRAVTKMPVPEDAVFDAVDDLVGYLDNLQALLSDRELSSMRMVLNLEKMVIKESQRNFTYLSLYDHSADAIVVNRVIPPEVEDPFLHGWRNLQNEHLQTVHDIFSPIPILEIPLFPAEVVGAPMLERMANALFGDSDPTDFLHHGRAFHIEQTDDGCNLIIPAPAIDKADIDLIRNGDEIVVRMGALKRHIVLPRSMMQFQHTSARLREDSLSIHFVRPPRP
jgi:arsenite/tail-anchored protein-transporting ATPase